MKKNQKTMAINLLVVICCSCASSRSEPSSDIAMHAGLPFIVTFDDGGLDDGGVTSDDDAGENCHSQK